MPYFRRRGMGQTAATMFPQCAMKNLPACSWYDTIYTTQACSDAGAACVAAASTGTPSVPALTPAGTPGVGIQVPTSSPDGVATAADYAAVAQGVADSQFAAQQALNAAVVQPVTDLVPSVAFSMPWWAWAAVAGVGLLVVLK